MSGTPYLDQDTADQCHEALRQGQTIDGIAGKLGMDAETLTRLLGLPSLRPVSQDDTDGGCDLWSADRLDSQL